MRPNVDDLVVPLAVGDQALGVLLFDFIDFALRLVNQSSFLDGMCILSMQIDIPALRRIVKPKILDLVQKVTVSR